MLPANYTSASMESEVYRLCVQYRLEDVSFHNQKLQDFMRLGSVELSGHALPFTALILSNSEFMKKCINISDDNAFTVIIEGTDYAALQVHLKMYTSLEFWNTVSYLEELKFDQIYSLETIKYAIQGRNFIKTLVIDLCSFLVTHFMNHTFKGPPKNGTRFALHVKVKQADTCISPITAEAVSFDFQRRAFESLILEGERLLEVSKNDRYFGPFSEIIIKGDDLFLLRTIRDNYMEFNLPNERLSCWYQFSNFHRCCLESNEIKGKDHRFVINLGECEVNFATAFNIKRGLPKPSPQGIADYYSFQASN